MAAWQESFELHCSSGLSDGALSELDLIGSRTPSGVSGVLWWGTEEGNRIDIFLKSGQPTAGLVRFDLREVDPIFIEGFAGWARSHQLVMRDSGGRPVDPSFGDIALPLQGSRAARLVSDPRLFLTRLRLGGLSDA